VDVSVRGDGGRKRRAGLRVHRSLTLDASMTTRRLSIPATTPQRTLMDLRRTRPARGGATAKQLRRAMRQASVLGLAAGIDTRPRRTRSDLELLFFGICRRHRIPLPEVNVHVAGLEVDFLWRENSVIAETDGYRYHRGRVAFEDDRRRDLELKLLGFEVLRFSEAQLEDTPDKVADALRHLLLAP
jgi:very-short-patch-repair endonuclease